LQASNLLDFRIEANVELENSRGQCYMTKMSSIFGEKKAFFLQLQWYDLIFTQNQQLFGRKTPIFFGEIICKNHNIGPWFRNRFKILPHCPDSVV
jgi:hypothetical protein